MVFFFFFFFQIICLFLFVGMFNQIDFDFPLSVCCCI